MAAVVVVVVLDFDGREKERTMEDAPADDDSGDAREGSAPDSLSLRKKSSLLGSFPFSASTTAAE